MLLDQPAPPVETFAPLVTPPAILRLAVPQVSKTPIHCEANAYHYIITGNTLLSPAAIQRAVAPAKNPRDALDRLVTAYHHAGYFLVALRAQVLADHRVAIAVVEGQVTKKDVPSGLGWFFSGLSHDPQITQDMMVQHSVLAESYANRNGSTIRVSFVPAPNPGGSTLQVSANPIPGYSPFSGNLIFGNYGSRYASGYVASTSVALNPGNGVELSANYTNGIPELSSASRGSTYYTWGVGLSSITPWGTYGFSTQGTHYIIGQAAYPLNPNGNIFTYALTGSQLIFASLHCRFGVNEAYTHVHNKVTVFQGAYTLTQQDYGYYTLGATYSREYEIFDQQGAGTLSVNYNQGISGANGTLSGDSPSAPTPQFHYLVFNGSLQQGLPFGMSLNFSGSGQWSFNTLPQQQQWVLGGFSTLSAWFPSVLVGDSGYFGRLALQSPSYAYDGVTVAADAFAEMGGASTHFLAPGQAPWQDLSDIGLKLTVSTRWGSTISVISALPVGNNHVAATIRHTDRNDVYFVWQQNF